METTEGVAEISFLGGMTTIFRDSVIIALFMYARE